MNSKKDEDEIQGLIQHKLKEIEEKEQVTVLHAVESGSRAWGFASVDSDYDVRFVYVHPMEYYLKLQDQKDFIDWELNETLDINGWDLKKALQYFHKSNATMFEWGMSPVVYRSTPEWEQILEVAKQYFSCKTSLYHYYGTANKNYLEYLTEDMVKYKKYFYVLRPILACKWIEKKQCPPPVLFQTMAEEVLEDSMKETVESLLIQKTQMTEAEKGPKIDLLNEYLEQNISCYKDLAANMPDDRKEDWEPLNQAFRSLLYK